MIDLLLSTFAMMGLTSLVGFSTAAAIKPTVYTADPFDFYSSHCLELLRLRRWRQHRQKVERLVRQMPPPDERTLGNYHEDFSRGINRNVSGYSGCYHRVDPGASEEDLMDHYYPWGVREFFLKEEELAHVNRKNTKKSTTSRQ